MGNAAVCRYFDIILYYSYGADMPRNMFFQLYETGGRESQRVLEESLQGESKDACTVAGQLESDNYSGLLTCRASISLCYPQES